MKRKVTRSKVYRILRRLLKTHTPDTIVSDFIEQVPLEKFLLILSNRCVLKSNCEPSKKRKRSWYGLARMFYRAKDELQLEEDKSIFKISRRDIYTCKCKKRFYVDPIVEKNCKFDMDKGVVVTCPACGKTG